MNTKLMLNVASASLHYISSCLLSSLHKISSWMSKVVSNMDALSLLHNLFAMHRMVQDIIHPA